MLPVVDWANVNRLYVAVLALLVFFSTLIGMLLSFKRVFRSAWLSALLFAAAFVFWNYYSHGLPLPIMITTQSASVPTATGDWSAQVKPAQQARQSIAPRAIRNSLALQKFRSHAGNDPACS